MLNIKKTTRWVNYSLIISLLLLTGCAKMHSTNTAATATAPKTETKGSESYFPSTFNDFEVPSELKLDSKHTMFINTSSFTGGIIVLEGRVEATSLADFFVNSMQKNNWVLTGEVRYNSILLSFTKPNKNCMISISNDSYSYNTKVNAYISESNQPQGGQ
ncbi:MAG: hypothetical protein GXP59_05055 [Deltaproteobacteria bacterium]|nr:hypothetical protein [Deltaproteobacteria bacterium]